MKLLGDLDFQASLCRGRDDRIGFSELVSDGSFEQYVQTVLDRLRSAVA